MKAADEIVLMDNVIYVGNDNMVAVENKAHEDKSISIVNAADKTDLMDNDIYESGGGVLVVENDTHE